jgi:DNA-directed RNA polymerase subunit RPC12/RpoP
MPTFPRTFICIDCKREFQYRNAMIMHRRFVHRDAASAPDKSAEAPVPAAKTLPTPTPGGRKTRQITRVTCPDCKMRLALNNLNRHRRARHDAVAVEGRQIRDRLNTRADTLLSGAVEAEREANELKRRLAEIDALLPKFAPDPVRESA